MPRRKKPETYSAIVHRSSGNITAACLVFPAYAGVKLSQINSTTTATLLLKQRQSARICF